MSENRSRLSELLDAAAEYRFLRQHLLDIVGTAGSNRDPLSELSEALVEAYLDGVLAESRVQPGYDLIDAAGLRVEVKYLANPAGGWINGHHITMTEQRDRYAIVFFEALAPIRILVFPRDLGPVCGVLGKRHGNQSDTLQLTHANYRHLSTDSKSARAVGVDTFDLTVR